MSTPSRVPHQWLTDPLDFVDLSFGPGPGDYHVISVHDFLRLLGLPMTTRLAVDDEGTIRVVMEVNGRFVEDSAHDLFEMVSHSKEILDEMVKHIDPTDTAGPDAGVCFYADYDSQKPADFHLEDWTGIA